MLIGLDQQSFIPKVFIELFVKNCPGCRRKAPVRNFINSSGAAKSSTRVKSPEEGTESRGASGSGAANELYSLQTIDPDIEDQHVTRYEGNGKKEPKSGPASENDA